MMRNRNNPGPGLMIGMCGWEHPDWTPGFYPEELPPEWRLTFYANHFTTVLVPAERWLSGARQDLEQWLDDTGDDFRFVLELPADHERRQDEIRLRTRILDERIAALVIPYTQGSMTPTLARFGDWPISIRAPDGVSEQERAQWRHAGASILWDPLHTPGPEAGGRVLVTVLHLPVDHDMVEVTQKLTHVCATFPGIAFFLSGPPHNGQKVRAAATLLGL
ncbi:MAG: DUF72 domain-containing protein [Acidiferrobacteraceae bacterium]